MRRIATGATALLVLALGLSAGLAQAARDAKRAPAAARTAAHHGPAVPHLHIYLPDAFFVSGQAVSVPGRTVHAGGVVSPYVPGQWVTVKAYQNGRQIRSELLRLKPSRDHRYGRFTGDIVAPAPGNVVVYVRHQRNSQLQGFLVHRSYQVLDENVGFGSGGLFVQLMQQRLSALHFFLPQTGVYDSGMGLAIDAYHRLLRWGTYQDLDGRTISYLLNGWGQFQVRYPSQGNHAEGNLGLQLLALINGGTPYWIVPISSGKPSTPTILGSFQIYRRVPYFRPDGMYFSSYFYSGYAIHGFNPAPDYPASHGCMRIPMADAVPVYNWLNYGDWVDTYY